MRTKYLGWAVFTILVACVVLQASVLLAQIPKDQAWQLLQSGAKEKEVRTRAVAIRALGLIRGNNNAEKLATEALSDESADVRISAASALGQMNAKGAIPVLKETLKDQDVGVILAAASSLRKLGDPSAYLVYYAVLTGERKSGQGLMAEQKKMLSDPKKMAQFGFEQGIGFVPFASIGYGALKAFTKDDKSPVRAAAAEALATDPDEKSGAALVTAASDESWIVRAAALDALAKRNDPSVVPEIIKLLQDSKPEVRYTAAATIYYLSGSATTTGK
jgi:HEAT repeat protein